MHPPYKDQTTLDVDNPKLDASSKPGDLDRTHQEYKNEADINYMLSRFGITQPRGAPMYGETDDTLDLQQALESTAEAQRAFRRLPKELQQKFTSMEELLQAVNNGTLVIKDEAAPEPTPAPAPTPTPA